jgi:hypothetical protein
MPDINYVADHINRIEQRHGGQQSLILDSKWRIASNLDLFRDELNSDGTLTSEQIAVVDSTIADFKATQAGQDAIAFYQRMAALQESNLESLFVVAFKGEV